MINFSTSVTMVLAVLKECVVDVKNAARKGVVSFSVSITVILLLLWFIATPGVNLQRVAFAATTHGTYTTSFPLTENPISEGGVWINGKSVGLDWADVRTTPGLAFGTQSGTESGKAQYADSTAVLSGTWGPDQTLQATVRTVNQSSSFFEEVELRLRSSITAHSNTGYEVNFRCTADGSQYVQIIRWNGPLASWTQIDGRTGPGLRNGDVVKATIVGSVITAYINGVQIVQATDSTYSSGSPGIGFFLQGATGVNSDFGFTSFSATDGSLTQPSPPANLTTTVQ